MLEDEGGETVCYLSQVDDMGTIANPRERVRTGNQNSLGATRVVVPGARWTALAPDAGETLSEYRERLEGPAERTAAWSIGLLALDEPVFLDASGVDPQYVETLAEYIRALIADD